MTRFGRLSILAQLVVVALGCSKARVAPEPVESSPPPAVWAEVESMAGDDPEFRDSGWFDPASVASMLIGVAHGPSRGDEARTIADAIVGAGFPLDDVWAVDALTWFDDGDRSCRDQVVFYNDEAAAVAAALRDSMPMSLALTPDTDSRYDVIVQLCPRGQDLVP